MRWTSYCLTLSLHLKLGNYYYYLDNQSTNFIAFFPGVIGYEIA